MDETPVIAEQTPNEAPPQDATKQLPTETQAETPEDAAKEEAGEEKPKPEKTPEQREIERLRRAVDRRTRQLAEARAQQGLQRQPIGDTNQLTESDSESLTLSRQQLAEMVKREAERLAPTLKQQEAEIEHRKGIVDSLAKTWGQEKFDAYAADLDDVLGGLAVNGKPKPATDAIFEAEKPAKVIEYLTDPDNAAEAEALASMNPIQAGRFVAKLEMKLEAKAKESKPQRSNAPAPIEPVRGQGQINALPDPKNTQAWIKEMNRREAAGLL